MRRTGANYKNPRLGTETQRPFGGPTCLVIEMGKRVGNT